MSQILGKRERPSSHNDTGIVLDLQLNKATQQYEWFDGETHLGEGDEGEMAARAMKRAKQARDEGTVVLPPNAEGSAVENGRNKLADHVSIARLQEPEKEASAEAGEGGDDEEMDESEGVDLAALEAARKREQLERYTSSSYVIPSCSSWFELDQIHELEMQSLPEFFCNKFPHKNPSAYIHFRNCIIKMYRERPSAYLSASGKLSPPNSNISCLISRMQKAPSRRCLLDNQATRFPRVMGTHKL